MADDADVGALISELRQNADTADSALSGLLFRAAQALEAGLVEHAAVAAQVAYSKGRFVATVSSHLDEIDAQVWPFINAEAVKVGAPKGHIDGYQYQQANGGVAVLWNGNNLHALAVTVRDDMNRTCCVRVLAECEPMPTDHEEPGNE
jgi:hypothetical protein